MTNKSFFVPPLHYVWNRRIFCNQFELKLPVFGTIVYNRISILFIEREKRKYMFLIHFNSSIGESLHTPSDWCLLRKRKRKLHYFPFSNMNIVNIRVLCHRFSNWGQLSQYEEQALRTILLLLCLYSQKFKHSVMMVLPALGNVSHYTRRPLATQTIQLNYSTIQLSTTTSFMANISRRKCVQSHCFRVFPRTVFNPASQTFIH